MRVYLCIMISWESRFKTTTRANALKADVLSVFSALNLMSLPPSRSKRLRKLITHISLCLLLHAPPLFEYTLKQVHGHKSLRLGGSMFLVSQRRRSSFISCLVCGIKVCLLQAGKILSLSRCSACMGDESSDRNISNLAVPSREMKIWNNTPACKCVSLNAKHPNFTLMSQKHWAVQCFNFAQWSLAGVVKYYQNLISPLFIKLNATH